MGNLPEAERNIGWRIIEEVVALLERTLQPFARVEHDVKLPVLGRKRRRQCDVVITAGEYPRQTITIVEVQKRHRRPDITTFHGWYRKMQEVGAQHLICVSLAGYPKSIIDEVATLLGPTVKLLTLAQLHDAKITEFDFILPFIFQRKPQVRTLEVGNLVVKSPEDLQKLPEPEVMEIVYREKIFSFGDSQERLSLIELGSEYLDRVLPKRLQEKNIRLPRYYAVAVTLCSATEEMWIHIGQRRLQVIELPIKMYVENRITRVPVTMFEYQQEFIGDALCWVAIARGIVNGVDTDVRIVFRKNESGFLHIEGQLLSGGHTLELDLTSDLYDSYFELSGQSDDLIP